MTALVLVSTSYLFLSRKMRQEWETSDRSGKLRRHGGICRSGW